MSKHNNNNAPCSSARCRCGRYISIAEDKAGLGRIGYTCPTCKDHDYSERYKDIQQK